MTRETSSLHADLEERLRFETLVTDLSLKFANLPSRDVDREIEDAQRCVCECLGLDVSSLWQSSPEAPRVLVLTHLYRRWEGPATPERMDAQEYFPWCQQQLLAGKTVSVSSLEDLPLEAARDRETWIQYDIKASLTFPLSAGGGAMLGALSFNTVHANRIWPKPLVRRLQLVAQVLANAIARKRSDDMLRESDERLSLAADSAGIGLWSLTLSTGQYWLTSKARELLGLSAEEELTADGFMSLVHPEDRGLVHQAMESALRAPSEVGVEYRLFRPDGKISWFSSRGRVLRNALGKPDRLMGVTLNIDQRKRIGNDLEDRLRFEKLLAELSASFVSVRSERVDEIIAESLKKLVEFLGNDRSTLIKFSEDRKHIAVTHSYSVPGCEPFPLGSLADDRLPWYLGQMRSGRTVFVRKIPEELPAEAETERRYCREQGIKSNVAIPLKAGGTVLGAITFAFLNRHCDWSLEIVDRLHLFAEVFANALQHQRADEAIRAAMAENEKLRARLEQDNQYLREQIVLKHRHERVIGQSDALRRVLSEAEKVAGTDTPVLLLGETGTGKELLAQTIHEISPRKNRPMVIVNCASLPGTLVESELFGREAGAYTGAASAQVGRFLIADGSTLFLDEVGEFPLELQAKLLRVLQDGRFERLGSPQTVTVNVRIIAATNRDLEQAVRDGKFRADLYHRLNVFPIHVPPLRERPEDIPALAWAFVDMFGRRMGKKIKSIPAKAIEQLQAYSWPGNVRELSNVIERAMILTTGSTLRVELPSTGQNIATARMTLKEGERKHILHVLHETGWRIRGARGAAELLEIKPTTLEARMAKLGIKREIRDSNIS